ncbi:hypothetical protein GCM10007907_16550 [Chitinimonas prasina]|uniref:Type VI secretion system tip protein VgrG n=1 Tax=Chitinimonas prasina TaxID=1434937 RepID=A0ABQ5YHN8_9NEIS|nr:contractile injection system protein, VgrG/Pvc8 family [Chitinimonas prasina]GLR12865.1 hypothetical protein GCM10007907_16550 [Chitinimonas prasina]
MNAPEDRIGITDVGSVEHTALYLHCAIFLDSQDIIGDETFRLVSFTGQDQVSEPFEYQLELRGNSGKPGRELRFDQLIGKAVTFGVGLPMPEQVQDPTAIEASSERFAKAIAGGASDGLALFNGIVAAFAMSAPGIYQLTVRPALWLLTLANRYTLYQDSNISDTLLAVLGYHHIDVDVSAVGGLALARTQDWLQVGESDYDFLRRLMGKAHLYFYFKHTARSHTLVLANRPEYPEALPGRKLRYTFTDDTEGGLSQFDVIGDYRYQQSLQISAVHTVFTRQDEAWQVDGCAGIYGFNAAKPDASDAGRVFRQHKIFQYGSSRSAAEHFASLTEQASRSGASQLSGQSFCPMFRAGFRFTMTEDVMEGSPMPVRPSLNLRQFVLTKVEHEASLDGSYKNRFEATEAEGLVSAFSLADTQQGSVLAVVVGHAESVTPPTDWRFLKKSDFDPGRSSYSDKESEDQAELQAVGAFVCLATDTAGTRRWVKLAAHMQTVPEIGAQVIVGRSNDESELPELQQIVSSCGNTTVTPSTWIASTNVGSSYGTRYGDGQNISFGASSTADLSKAVDVVTKAYATGKFRETSYGQGANYGLSTAESTAPDATQDLSTTYGSYGPTSDLLRVDESFGSSFGRSTGKVSSNIVDYGISYNRARHDKTESYTTVDDTAYTENTHNGNVTNKTTINATSTSTETIDIRSNSSAIGVSNSNEAVGISNSNSVTGASNQNTLTGASLQIHLTGASSTNSAVGASMDLSATGASMRISVTGVATEASSVGARNTVDIVGENATVKVSGPGILFQSEMPVMKYDISGMEISLISALKMIL